MAAQKSGCTVLVVQEGRGCVVLFSSADPSGKTRVPVGEKPHEIELSPDGRHGLRLELRSSGSQLERGHAGDDDFCPGCGEACRTRPAHPASGLRLAARVEAQARGIPSCSPTPRWAIKRSWYSTPGRAAFCALFRFRPGVHNFVFGADGGALFAFTLGGEVCRIDPEAGGIAARTRTGSPRGLALTADARHLAREPVDRETNGKPGGGPGFLSGCRSR